MLEFGHYIVVGLIFSGLIMASAVVMLTWAVKRGQFKNLERGAVSIFDEEEPLGVQTDYFPGEREKLAKRQDRRPGKGKNS